ncbi:uncharacterized protein [Diadema setosum]|uniref:uncharacterized protein n=1 Tax=Diadema setosum TaxID=31175 RepID=UPI003B3B732D
MFCLIFLLAAPYPDKAAEAAYPPPQQPGGYAPVPTEQTPYPPQQTPYPPQQTPYPPQQSPYPPQQQGYPAKGPPPAYGEGQAAYAASGQNVVVGPAPQTTVIVRQAQAQPNDYLAFAIFVTICCCLPLGIVAIIKSMDVRSRYTAGDMNGALEASRSAKNWSVAGLVIGIILEVIAIIIIIVYFVVIIAAVNTYTPY